MQMKEVKSLTILSMLNEYDKTEKDKGMLRAIRTGETEEKYVNDVECWQRN